MFLGEKIPVLLARSASLITRGALSSLGLVHEQDSRAGDCPFDSISKFWRQNSLMHANILVA